VARVKRTSRSAFTEKARARRVILSQHAEEMVARIRLHVNGCPPCADVICGEGLPVFVARLDEELRAKRGRVARAPPPRGRGAAKRSTPRRRVRH
jgi:hypothetical protein